MKRLVKCINLSRLLSKVNVKEVKGELHMEDDIFQYIQKAND